MTFWRVTLTTGYIQGLLRVTTELAAASGAAAKLSQVLGGGKCETVLTVVRAPEWHASSVMPGLGQGQG